MASRPHTARSEISSAISDDGLPSPLAPSTDRATSTTPGPPVSPHGYSHFRGVTNPTNTTNRAIRSPPPPSSTSGASRPQSPESTTSRTHVPSLTAQGFLRPINSSRLQQQRRTNLRASRATGNSPQPPETADSTINEDDTYSIHSNRTGPYASMPKQHRPATSITTGYTESEANYDTTSQQYASEAENEFLQNPSKGEKRATPSPLNLTTGLKVTSPREKPMLSPRSFRSGFTIGSKQIVDPSGHQQLPSTQASPRYPNNMQEKHYIAQQSALGKNYEYFEGNTMFWLGGRLQNARDRPINLLTGALIVVPSVLFFVFK